MLNNRGKSIESILIQETSEVADVTLMEIDVEAQDSDNITQHQQQVIDKIMAVGEAQDLSKADQNTDIPVLEIDIEAGKTTAEEMDSLENVDAGVIGDDRAEGVPNVFPYMPHMI